MTTMMIHSLGSDSKPNHVILHLSLIDGVGPATIQTIVEKKPEDCAWYFVYHLRMHDWMHQFGFTQKIATKLCAGLSQVYLLEQEIALIEKYQIKWTTILSSDYPYLLKQIYLPPVVLYWQGENLDDNQKRLAFVGSRKANSYGRQVIDHLISPLVACDWAIVSGGALGIDSMSHEAAVRAKGKTIAVLGSGLLRPYPQTNKKLFDTIIAHGSTIVSSFPLRMNAQPGSFPARNRIIAGLSRGCVVVQAAAKSGARITAQFALEQGREVFAVPGPLADELSAGCHALIQSGAKLIAGAEDILQEFGEAVVVTGQKNSSDKITDRQQVKVVQEKQADDNSIQAQIVRACLMPCSIDELAEKMDVSLPELQNALFELQLEGAVQQDFTGMWQRS